MSSAWAQRSGRERLSGTIEAIPEDCGYPARRSHGPTATGGQVTPTPATQSPLTGVVLAEHLHRGGSLGVADLLVALLQGLRLQTLPGEAAAQEVHEHVAQSLQVVPPALL